MPRQSLSVSLARIAAVGALCLAAPAALAQFSISAQGAPSGPGTCDVATVVVPVTGGSLTVNAPAPPNNVIFISSVNGGPPFTGFSSIPSGVTPHTTFALEVDPPSLPPYTMVQSYFPATGGAPTGTGVTFTVACNAAGVATLSWVNNVPAPGGGTGGGSVSAAPIPTLSTRWLAALMALLGATALAGVSRRSRG